MIIATSKADAMLKRSLGRGQVTTTTLQRMCEQFKIDPTTATPVRDAYVVTNEDISAARAKTLFEQSLATKHPATKVIFINKSAKPIYANGMVGIDVIMQKPKTADITQAISAVIASGTVDIAVQPTIDTYNQPIPEYTNPVEETPVVPDFVQPEPVEEPVAEPLYVPEPEPEPQVPVAEVMQQESSLVNRIKHASTVADVSILAREIDATTLIKDLVESNSTYAGIEEKLKSLNDTIFAIMSDVRISSLDEKLSKIHAVMHDKAFFNAKGDTLIEQRLEEVIDAICTQTSSLLQSRLDEIDTAIKRAQECKDMENNSARLAGLNELRANIIIELKTLEIEIETIYKSCDNIIISSATKIAETNDNITGNEMINSQLKARGSYVVSDGSFTAMVSALELSEQIPDLFKSMKLNIIKMTKLLHKLFDLDQEVIAAQQALINFLKAHNVEDSIVAQGVLKKALRVYVGAEGTGKTIIPYLISRYKSRQNANVLLLDLTGTNKYADYGIQYTDVDTYLAELNQKEFMLVAGNIDNTVAAAQRIVTTLLHAADYYRVINVVLNPEQQELFQTIAEDVLSVNFITDTSSKNITAMRSIIEKCTIRNVGRRVIINKCDVPVRSIVTKLGLDDQIDFQLCTVKTLPTIIDAGINGYNPYGVSSVDLEMEEVIKHA